MNEALKPANARKEDVRESPAAASLLESQFEEAWSISGILAGQIRKHGIFREKLSDYAYAFARTERFDMIKGEEIIRDVFKARYGQTMNQMRERLVSQANELDNAIDNAPLRHAHSVIEIIQTAPTKLFYRAYDQAAFALANEKDITETAAKEMMKEAFRSHEGRELYDAGKEAEARFHKPARNTESRSSQKSHTRKRQQSQALQ